MSDNFLKHSSNSGGILSGQPLAQDQEPEIVSLRPEKLSEYIGI